MLEFARSVGKKSEEITKLKKEKEFSLQEMSHLKQQVDELSRLQHPREFRLVSPTTIGINGEVMTEMGELGIKRGRGVGFDLMDRHVHLDTAIERAVGRWKTVVKGARGGVNGGMASQRSLSGESAPPTSASAPPTTSQQVPPPPAPTQNHQGQNLQHIAPAPPSQNHATQNQNQNQNQNHSQPRMPQDPPPPLQNIDSQSDADADADADMEDDDSFVEMDVSAATKYRLTNGNGGNSGQRMEGLEQAVQVQNGYVRIGA